jgi:hypothetical protein
MDGAEREHDVMRSCDANKPSLIEKLNARRALPFEEDTSDRRTGQYGQVRLVHARYV